MADIADEKEKQMIDIMIKEIINRAMTQGDKTNEV